MKKYVKLILLFTVFLITIQIAQGQSLFRTTPNSADKVCIPTAILDTMIHDLNQWKLLKEKERLSQSYISSLENRLSLVTFKNSQTEILLIDEKRKRKRNGWQRNGLIGIIVIPTILKLSGVSLF